mmetsp:Transcript_55619/g.132054  ORF Transcript_55619/g.132054 Transcript_55619/m.132054 type:complete len:387 (-) Transcript_55619:106-1266(-)
MLLSRRIRRSFLAELDAVSRRRIVEAVFEDVVLDLVRHPVLDRLSALDRAAHRGRRHAVLHPLAHEEDVVAVAVEEVVVVDQLLGVAALALDGHDALREEESEVALHPHAGRHHAVQDVRPAQEHHLDFAASVVLVELDVHPVEREARARPLVLLHLPLVARDPIARGHRALRHLDPVVGRRQPLLSIRLVDGRDVASDHLDLVHVLVSCEEVAGGLEDARVHHRRRGERPARNQDNGREAFGDGRCVRETRPVERHRDLAVEGSDVGVEGQRHFSHPECDTRVQRRSPCGVKRERVQPTEQKPSDSAEPERLAGLREDASGVDAPRGTAARGEGAGEAGGRRGAGEGEGARLDRTGRAEGETHNREGRVPDDAAVGPFTHMSSQR